MSVKSEKAAKSEGRELTRLVRAGTITPEQYPGRSNQAYRVLIRSIRAADT